MMRLHGYWRSTATYRVRIALALKQVSYELVAHDLRTGAHKLPGFVEINPQGLVPAVELDGFVLGQSLAILEWLEERYPSPSLLPASTNDRAIVRAMSQLICCDIHPLNNLRTLQTLRSEFSADDAQVRGWMARWIHSGFGALDTMIDRFGGDYCFGFTPTMADCCLVPQAYSAERFGIDIQPFTNIRRVVENCRQLRAFQSAKPELQPDAD